MNLQTGMNMVGFVDSHVHVRGPEGLAQVAAARVVAVRDAGLRENAEEGYASRTASSAGPRVVSALWALYKKGCYGSPFGVAVESRTEMTAEILKLARVGAGIIKIMASGIVSLREPGKITSGGFTGEEMQHIIGEAARFGLEVMAHANGEQAIMAAAQAGVRSIEHGFFMTRRSLDAMAKAGTFWIPTVGALVRAGDAGAVSATAREYIGGSIRSHLEMIASAQARGVPLAAGTDCVLPDPNYESAFRAELAYFEQAGLPRDLVMKIATENGKQLLKIL